MRPYAGVDYNLTLCPLQSRLQKFTKCKVIFTCTCSGLAVLKDPVKELEKKKTVSFNNYKLFLKESSNIKTYR
jgi:hypothetical protein